MINSSNFTKCCSIPHDDQFLLVLQLLLRPSRCSLISCATLLLFVMILTVLLGAAPCPRTLFEVFFNVPVSEMPPAYEMLHTLKLSTSSIFFVKFKDDRAFVTDLDLEDFHNMSLLLCSEFSAQRYRGLLPSTSLDACLTECSGLLTDDGCLFSYQQFASFSETLSRKPCLLVQMIRSPFTDIAMNCLKSVCSTFEGLIAFSRDPSSRS